MVNNCRVSNEKLIEEAFEEEWYRLDGVTEPERHRRALNAALAVFEKAHEKYLEREDAEYGAVIDQLEAAEKAHTATDDEREALLRDLYTLRGWSGGNINRRIDIIDRTMSVLRRSVVPEPSVYEHWSLKDHVRRAVMVGLGLTPFPKAGETFDATAMVERVLSSLAETGAPEPQGEPSGALDLVIHAERVGAERDDPLILELAEALRAAGVGGAR